MLRLSEIKLPLDHAEEALETAIIKSGATMRRDERRRDFKLDIFIETSDINHLQRKQFVVQTICDMIYLE